MKTLKKEKKHAWGCSVVIGGGDIETWCGVGSCHSRGVPPPPCSSLADGSGSISKKNSPDFKLRVTKLNVPASSLSIVVVVVMVVVDGKDALQVLGR